MFLWIKTPDKPAQAVRRNRPLEEPTPVKPKRQAPSLNLGKVKLPKTWVIAASVAGILLIVVLAYQYQQEVTLKEVKIEVVAKADNAFMNDQKVLEAMGWAGGVAPLGEKFNSLPLAELEDSLRKSPYVLRAELYKSIQGVLHVQVEMRDPVARLMNNSETDVYIDAYGKKFPVSRQHSANVLLVRGDFDEAVADTFACETILSALPVLNYLANDPYWDNYFSEAQIDGNGEITLFPRLDPMEVEFGHPHRIEEKLRDLKIFLDQIMAYADRPRFRKISVKYQGQVLATKR